jgi:TolB-like protein/DNA-binding winged helix-turn-helix (wHTH) protein/cytochrome c-type biogenesis protein CcmH/NrfG
VVSVPSPVSAARRLSFGPFEADLHSGELRKNGAKVPLQAQPFQLLVMLLERPGELITREEICQKLWSADTFVDFDRSLGVALNKIREALRDSAANPRYIETLPRKGYRFVAEVVSVPETALAVAPTLQLDSEVNEPNRKKATSHRLVWATSSILLVVIVVAGLVTWRTFRHHPIDSIAVLPLASLSSDPSQQFLAYGVTDELTTNLAQIRSVRVSSHTSSTACSGTQKSASQMARCLGVDALVEGSVVRSGDRVRLTVQLIDAASDRHLWAQTYDSQLTDIITTQREVTRAIAAGISAVLTPQEQARLFQAHPINPEVADLYFKGSYYLSKLDLDRAKETFSAATRLDPKSAEAWAGFADACHHRAANGGGSADFVQARDAANKALEIDPSQAEALMVLGILSFSDWKPAESEAFFRRSIEARPSYAMAHMLFGVALAHYGRTEEAIQQAKLASTLDPVSVLTNSMGWHVYFCARQYDEALRIILRVMEVDPAFGPAYFRLHISWEQKGEYQKAIDTRVRGRIAEGESPEKAHRDVAELRAALASGGARGYWQRQLEILLRDRKPDDRGGFSPIARCYMRLGKREEALQTLEKAYQLRDSRLILWLPAYEEFDPLRSDPRFQKILHGLGIS